MDLLLFFSAILIMSFIMSASNSGNTENIRFNFYKLRFTPYKEATGHNTKSILKAAFGYLNTELTHGRGHLIDRNANRKNEEQRPLFMTIAFTDLQKNRIRGTLALLRSGRLPYLKPAEKYSLVPLDTSKGDIAEQTHFFIDYSKGDDCIICMEFNSNGPRISDLEYYMRNVASDRLELARATTVDMFMDNSIEKALAELSNVLNFDIKLQPKKLNLLDTDMQGYFTAMRNFANQVKPKFLKIEAMFQTQGKAIKLKEENREATTMIKTLLNRFVKKPENLDSFDNFVIRYEDKFGNEDVLNLLRGKKEFFKEIDLKTVRTSKDWYNVIESDFDDFMKTL